MPDNNREKQERQENGRFKVGVSGNPYGRPVGSRSKASQLVQEMLFNCAEDITKTLITHALAGDAGCLKLAIERLFPAPKDSGVTIPLPTVQKSSDIIQAIAAVIERVSQGIITPQEGQALIKIFEGWKAAYNLEEIERRIEVLEEHQREKF